jgi:hypothetical protein
MPSIHFVGGHATSLRGLAELAAKMAIHPVKLSEAPPRDFDVGRFVGNPECAKKILGLECLDEFGDRLCTSRARTQGRPERSRSISGRSQH